MSRSASAAAGATTLALALTPTAALAAGGSRSAAPPRGALTNRHHYHHTHHHPAITRRHSSAPAAAPQHLPVTLAPGSGDQHAAGSSRVRGLQRRLTRLGFTTGPVDGRYGPQTTHAVQQHAHQLRRRVQDGHRTTPPQPPPGHSHSALTEHGGPRR
jgi:hypothetical protein